jgi:hypothetical protein
MADEKSTPEEFRTFIRELGVRAFDQLASRLVNASDAIAEQSDRVGRRSASLSRLAGYWSGMQPVEKELFFDQMIAAAQTVAAAAPGMIGMGRLRKKKRGLPEEVRNSFSPEIDIDNIDEIPVLDLKTDDNDRSKKSKKKKKKKKKEKLQMAGDDTDNGKKKKKKKKKKKNKS